MSNTDAEALFRTLNRRVPFDEYNYEHFRPKHLFRDVKRTLNKDGIPPREIAPDFELPCTDGGSLRLSDLRGKPVLLHFGSLS